MTGEQRATASLRALTSFGDRLALASGVEPVFETALAGLDELCGHHHSLLLVHQPESGRLATVASRGYDARGTGSEVALGEGLVGMVAARRSTMRIGNLQRMLSYARTVRRSAIDGATVGEIPLPGLADARSQLAAPMMARGELLGVLATESAAALAYDEVDERVITIAAHLVAAAIERELLVGADTERPTPDAGPAAPPRPAAGPLAVDAGAVAPVVLRHYALDGSTFVDDDYVIKGVAGRLLWKLVSEHAATGRTSFTNREAKLDPTLGLPEYRDNFESRLILLKRRLEEHAGVIRIHPSGRGRFDLEVRAALALQLVAPV